MDIDVHLHEVPADLARYCERPWDAGLAIAKDSMERYLSVPGLSPPTSDDTIDPSFPGGMNIRVVATPAQMRKDLDDLGVDVGILFPDHLLKIALFPDREYAMALARAYNRWLIDTWLRKEKGLYGALCIAPQDPESSAEEIKKLGRNRENGINCVYFPTAGLPRLYGHREYDVLYEAIERAGIPIILHGVSAIASVFPFNLEQYPGPIRHALSHPMSMVANLMHMIGTGVPVRFPKLKIAFSEGAIAWVPWVMMRLDKEYLERRRELPFLEERPSHYVRKFYFGTQPIEEPEKAGDYLKLVELIGRVESVLFSSDWPHHDFDHPNKLLGYPLSDEAKRKIMGENALEFFDMERPQILA